MKTELVAIDTVRPLDRNPRRHPEKQLAELVKSIEQFGQYRPLVVDEDGLILAGNGLHTALKRAGVAKVSVYRMKGLSEDQKRKLILADNKTGDLSNDDFDVIEAMVRELDDYEVPGFDPDVLRGIIAEAEDVLADADDYGRLDDRELDALRASQEDIAAADEQATVGTPPPPISATGSGAPAGLEEETSPVVDLDFSTGTPAGDALADAVETRKREGHVCPACGRGW